MEQQVKNASHKRAVLRRFVIIIGILLCGMSVLFIGAHILRGLLLEYHKKQLNQSLYKRSTLFYDFLDRAEKDLTLRVSDQALHDAMTTIKKQGGEENNVVAWFQEVKAKGGYRDVLIFDQRGTLLFTVTHPTLVGKNYLKEGREQSIIGSSLSLASATMSVTLSSINQEFSQGAYSSIIVVPLVVDDSFQGFLAFELDFGQLFDQIAEKNSLLGSVGDVVLGDYVADKERLFISQAEEAEKYYGHNVLLYGAFQGHEGCGINYDTPGGPHLFCREYLAAINAGLLMTQELWEVVFWATVLEWLAYLFGFLACLFALFMVYRHWKRILVWGREIGRHSYSFYTDRSSEMATVLCALGAGLCLFFMCVFGAHYYIAQRKKGQQLKHKHQETLRLLMRRVNQDLLLLTKKAHKLAEEFSKQQYSPDGMDTLVRAVLDEHPNILGIATAYKPYAFDKKTRLYAPYWVRGAEGIEVRSIPRAYDYTAPEEGTRVVNDWYIDAVESNTPKWTQPFFGVTTGEYELDFSVPFYAPQDTDRTEPIGVINMVYLLDDFSEELSAFERNTLGKIVIVNQDGRFIYHPDRSFLTNRSSIIDEREGRGGSTKDLKGIVSAYLHKITPASEWIVTDDIVSTGWILGLSFPKKAFFVAPNLHALMWLLCFFMLFLVFLGYFIIPFILGTASNVGVAWAVWLGIVFGFGNAALWLILHRQAWDPPVHEEVVRSHVDIRHLFSQTKKSLVKTGVMITNVGLSDLSLVHMYADIWQRYTAEQAKKMSGDFPLTIHEAKVLRVQSVDRSDYTQVGGVESKKVTFTWDIFLEHPDHVDLYKYPFIKRHILVVLDDKSGQRIPVPDFNAFDFSLHNQYPWIHTSLQAVLQSTLEDSFFSYKKDNGGVTDYSLRLHLVVSQNIFDILWRYLLPLFIMFFAMFSILWLDPARQIYAYISVAFVATLHHSTLRSHLAYAYFVYLETFFVFVYMTILLLLLYAIICQRNKPLADRTLTAMRVSYWPVQLFLWFIVTLLFFY